MVSEGCGDVGGLGQAQDGDREVAQAGHDAGAVAGADLGQVLAERHVADPMESVSYTHLRAHETPEHLVCRLLLEKKKNNQKKNKQIKNNRPTKQINKKTKTEK